MALSSYIYAMRLKPKSPPPEIKPRWETAFQYAGPLPKGTPVPADKDQLQAKPAFTRITPERVVLNPGSSVSVPRRDSFTPPSQTPDQASPMEKQFEVLKHYQKNFPEDFKRTSPDQHPRAAVPATRDELKAMAIFDRAIRKSDPEGIKTMTGEFGAMIDFRERRPLTSFKYQDGRSVTQSRDKQASAQYCLHSHRFDPNGPPAPDGDPFSNVGSSRFPSLPDYLGASNASLRAEGAGNSLPTFLMKNGDDYYRYYPDRMAFDKLERPDA